MSDDRKIAKCFVCGGLGYLYSCDGCEKPLCFGCANYLYDESWLCDGCDHDRKDAEKSEHSLCLADIDEAERLAKERQRKAHQDWLDECAKSTERNKGSRGVCF